MSSRPIGRRSWHKLHSWASRSFMTVICWSRRTNRGGSYGQDIVGGCTVSQIAVAIFMDVFGTFWGRVVCFSLESDGGTLCDIKMYIDTRLGFSPACGTWRVARALLIGGTLGGGTCGRGMFRYESSAIKVIKSLERWRSGFGRVHFRMTTGCFPSK